MEESDEYGAFEEDYYSLQYVARDEEDAESEAEGARARAATPSGGSRSGSGSSASGTRAPPETDDSSGNYTCTCPWLDQISAGASEGGGGPATASPSDLLYDELVHRDYVCRDSEEPSSSDSRYTPDSGEERQAPMVPFKVRWSLGFTIKSYLINFTRGNRREFYIATAHKGNIYNYQTNEMRYVHGHIKPVKAVSIDETGQWLVTGGRGYHSKIIVTDSIKCKQLLILENADEDMGSLLLGMSPDARYFLSVHYLNSPAVRVWKWTYGSDQPDFTYNVAKHFVGNPRYIAYHPNDQNFIAIAFEKLIVMCHYNDALSELEDCVHINVPKKLGFLTDCELVRNRHEVYCSTSNGYIAIFGNALYTENIREHPLTTEKMYVKKIKVSRGIIKTLKCPDNIICILESKGSLKFFDTNILLLYWIETELPPIQMISFSLDVAIQPTKLRMNLKIVNPEFSASVGDGESVETEEDRVLDYEMLLKQGVRSRASLLRRPFIVRDFIAGCVDGRIFYVDIVNDIYRPYFSIADSPVASLCVSTTRTLLYVAYQSGRVTIFDYESLECVLTSTVLVMKKKRRKLHEEEEIIIYNNSILISNLDVHLVIARSNGDLIFLSPILVPLAGQRYKFTQSNIERLAFSENNQYLAFYDAGRTLTVLRYHEEHWYILMKFRGHSEAITDMLFLHFEDPRLYTIGRDRYIVEYSLKEEDREMPLKLRVKIEDTAIPLCFLYYPTPPGAEKYFLVANSESKFKLINERTMKCRSLTVGPHHGCYESPVSRMILLPNSHGKYIIFQNATHMGILKTPPDGSPYKHIGILANPQLGSIGICNQGKYVFTYANGEGGILVWNINTNSLDILHYMGGSELEPYYCLIEGGSTGWFFKELEDLFCYMQILHQEDAYSSQAFGNSIYIADLPDLVRACGFYPSEYELEQLIYEIQNKDIEKTGELREKITFIEFVKLFLNHRPAYGVSTVEMEQHFSTLFNEECSSQEFSKVMCKFGDQFTEESLNNCLTNLMSKEEVETEEENMLDKLEPISFEYFTKTMLGILQESAYTEVQERAIREASVEDL